MRSLFVPLRLATNARRLEFVTVLDANIDKVSRRALYEAQGESADMIARQLSENPDEDGIVVGDETRLRQIITNLARCVSWAAAWLGCQLLIGANVQ
jgi:osomolarity two-component system, sensor histidine kinase SLN1